MKKWTICLCQEELMPYCFGEIDDIGKAAIEEHLRECRRCSRRAAEMFEDIALIETALEALHRRRCAQGKAAAA